MAGAPIIWTDVRFDHAAAIDAATECDRSARLVRDAARRRNDIAASVLVEGRGPWRDELARHLARLDHHSAELDARLRALAGSLREASARARIEQARREAGREEAPTGSVGAPSRSF